MNQKTIPKNKLGDCHSRLLCGSPYRRFSLLSTANSQTKARFQDLLHKFKANPEFLVTKVEPYFQEDVAYIVAPKSEEATAIRASYLVTKAFQEAYKKAYVGRRREITRRRVRNR